MFGWTGISAIRPSFYNAINRLYVMVCLSHKSSRVSGRHTGALLRMIKV